MQSRFGDGAVFFTDVDAKVIPAVPARHDACRAAATNRIQHQVARFREAEDQVLGELIGKGRGVLQFELVSLGVARRVEPNRAAALHVVDGFRLDLLEATVRQPVSA